MPVHEYIKGKKTCYYYEFEVKDANGERKVIKKRGFKGKIECRNAEADARSAWNKDTYIKPSKLLFGEYIQDWLDKKQNLSEGSRYTNQGHLKNHILPFMGHILLIKINVSIIEDFVKYLQEKKLPNGKKLSGGTIKKIFNFVQTSLNAAVKKELISRNPTDLLDTKPTVGKAKMDYWSKKEVQHFLNKCDHRLKILFVVAIQCGMRRGEILGLRFSDIDYDNARITIRQTLGFYGKIKVGAKTVAGNRSISIAPDLLLALKKHKLMIAQEKMLNRDKYIDNDFVFCSEFGQKISVGNFHKFWVRVLDNSKSRYIKFHDLRHTAASLLLQTPNVHPKVVQELLGHSSIKVTLDLYSHMMPNIQENAVAAMEQMLKQTEKPKTETPKKSFKNL